MSVASRVDPPQLCVLFNMISRSIVLVALVVVAAQATSVRKEAPVVADNDQFVMDFKGKKSPAQVMIDTLGKVVLDMRSDQKRDTELYKKIKSRCASELKSADIVMENDVKELKSASQKVKEDLQAVGDSGKAVNIQRMKCDQLRSAAQRVNETMRFLKQQRQSELGQLSVHRETLRDNHNLLTNLKTYITEGAARLAAMMNKDTTSLLEVRSRGTTRVSKLWQRLHNSIKSLAPEESDPATKMEPAPKIVKGAKTEGMPEGMGEIISEIQKEMAAAANTYEKQTLESKGAYEKEFGRLEIEYNMLDAQLEQHEAKYEEMKKTHARAISALNALNTGSGDWSYRLIADNAKAAIASAATQCEKFDEAYHARLQHRQNDEVATRNVVKVIQQLFYTIVGKAKK